MILTKVTLSMWLTLILLQTVFNGGNKITLTAAAAVSPDNANSENIKTDHHVDQQCKIVIL